MKGASKDKHPVSRKSGKANNTAIPTTCSVLGTQKFKETDMALPLAGITEAQLIHKKKCRDNSGGANCLEGNRALHNEKIMNNKREADCYRIILGGPVEMTFKMRLE